MNDILKLIQQFIAQGQYQDAESACRTALRKARYDERLLKLLGIACLQGGKPSEAVDALTRAARHASADAGTHAALGCALCASGDYARGVEAHARAAELEPNNVAYLSNLGDALRQAGHAEDAVAACQKALALQSGQPAALINLALALRDLRRLGEALEAARKAVAVAPTMPLAWRTLYLLLTEAGEREEALSAYQRAIELDPAETTFPLAVIFSGSISPQEAFAAHRRWSERVAEPVARLNRRHPNSPDPDRKLKIGYVSADLRDHAIQYFLEPVLQWHDRGRFDVFLYKRNAGGDSVTARLQNYPAQWRDVSQLAHTHASEMVAQDGIDILVDLASHTDNDGLLIFAHKPAPVQATWLAYACTTGLTAIDWRITDHCVDPPGETETLHTERLMRLPRTQWAYRPPANAPAPAASPVSRDGCVTFGWAGSFIKASDEILDLWAQVVAEEAGSKMRMMGAVFEEQAARDKVVERFARRGVAADRLGFAGYGDLAKYLGFLSEIDILLDTFPFNGGTTTCHSLWMGTPVVSLTGKAPWSRVGRSILRSIGLPELTADTPEGFVAAAISLANDRPRMIELRQTLRERMVRSPLCDERGFVGDLEDGYRTMWNQWIESRAERSRARKSGV